jgi:CRP/FNR family cyclic AMP-dependent transcriptional regulator
MDIKYLLDNHFKIDFYKKGETIYHPATKPKAVYFIMTGKVKMVTVNEDGQEFIQGIFKVDEFFGEPALLLDKPYLAFTIAMENSEIIEVPKVAFLRSLTLNADFSMRLILTLSERLFYKSMMLEELANENAEHRLKTILEFLLKDLVPGQGLHITRQQLADMTGLRVETVIRIMKHLTFQNGFKLIKGKIVKELI